MDNGCGLLPPANIFGHFIPKLFGFHSINNRIEHWRYKEVEVAKNGVDMGWNPSTKPVSEKREKRGSIRDEHDTDVCSAGVDCFMVGFFRRQMHDSPND